MLDFLYFVSWESGNLFYLKSGVISLVSIVILFKGLDIDQVGVGLLKPAISKKLVS